MLTPCAHAHYPGYVCHYSKSGEKRKDIQTVFRIFLHNKTIRAFPALSANNQNIH